MKKKISISVSVIMILIVTYFTSISYAATIGQEWTAPESGWQRINDNHPLISYEGSYSYINDNSTTASYLQDTHMTTNIGDIVKFEFMGTKLRLVGAYVLNRSNSIQVYIDNVLIGTFSEYADSYGIGQRLVFEKTGLSNTRHSVKIVNQSNNSNTYFSLDAVEFDESGSLLAPLADRSLLTIYIQGGQIKEYDLSRAEIDAFISWYDTKDAGIGPGKYAFTKSWNNGPFKSRTEYVVFDKILAFDVDVYDPVTQ